MCKRLFAKNSNASMQQTSLLGGVNYGYDPLSYDPQEVINKLKSYKNVDNMLADCKKHGIENKPGNNFYSDNKTEQAIKEQLYTLLHHYEWLGADESYFKLIDDRIDMFQEIIDADEKARIEDLEAKGVLCPKCSHGKMETFNTGILKVEVLKHSGGPMGGGTNVTTNSTIEYQFHYKKCDECGHWEMIEYRETPNWWDKLWGKKFTKGDIIEEYKKGNVRSQDYKSHNITRW